MKIVYTDKHRLHFPKGELHGGRFVTPFERPSRMDHILRALKSRRMTDFVEPAPLDLRPVRKIHPPAFLTFLQTVWDEWKAAGFKGDVLPTGFPARGLRQKRPRNIDGLTGYYAHSLETCITAGTWQAACASAAVAQTAQRLVSGGERAAFALCRPPGHHAHADLYGGYCFLNNAAIAAQGFRDEGAGRVAILDVDFHHGNGTQDIFYRRADVFYCSLHGDPADAYPYFLGFRDETGEGKGEGLNLNLPLPPGTSFDTWSRALERACRRIAAFKPDVLVVSLGVDTYKDDPISFFKLESEDFRTCGRRLAKLKRPTLFVMEGGYAIDRVGVNTVNVLEGFLDG